MSYDKVILIDQKTDQQATVKNGRLLVSGDVTLMNGDIEIGSVELKNSTSDDRATIYPSGALRVSGDVNLVNGDIEIGAVELKNYNTDDRAKIYSTGQVFVSGDVFMSPRSHSYYGELSALNSALNLDPEAAQGAAVFQVSGTWTGKLVVEGGVDSTYNNLSIVQPGGAITFNGIQNDNQNGIYRVLIIGGYTKLRIRMSSYTNGTAIINANTAPLVPTTYAWQLNAANLQVTTTQGSSIWVSSGDSFIRDGAGTANRATVFETGALKISGDSSIVSYNSRTNSRRLVRQDGITDALLTIDYPHHEVHSGSHYFCSDWRQIDSGASGDWLITTPSSTSWAHFSFEVDGSAITEIKFHESCDRTGIESLSVYNSDRNSSSTSGVTVSYGTTGGTTVGTPIYIHKGGAATAQTRSSTTVNKELEMILKQNTKYLLRIGSGTNTNLIAVKLYWYDHVNLI